MSAINIIRVAERAGVSCEQVSSGNFTHRCKCPGRDHKSGSERTGSLYIDADNNNFYCFGCGASNNVIDFYMLCNDVDFSTALKEMSEFVDPAKVTLAPAKFRQTNFLKQLDLSNILRSTQRAHPEDIEWIEGLMKKVDGYIAPLDRYDVDSVDKILRNVKRIIGRRYQRK